jgi:hypothetical protein
MPAPDPPPQYLSRSELAERRALRRRSLHRRRIAGGLALLVVAAVALLLTQAGGSSHLRSGQPVARRPPPVRHRRGAPRRARPAGPDRGVDRVLAYTSYLSVGAGRHRDVALTFDDGPGPYTPQVLAVLARYRVPATFFTVGTAVQKSPRLVREEAKRGYAIGDHTVHHAYLGHLGAAGQQSEIAGEAAALKRAGVPAPRLFRPPYGAFDPTTL